MIAERAMGHGSVEVVGGFSGRMGTGEVGATSEAGPDLRSPP